MNTEPPTMCACGAARLAASEYCEQCGTSHKTGRKRWPSTVAGGVGGWALGCAVLALLWRPSEGSPLAAGRGEGAGGEQSPGPDGADVAAGGPQGSSEFRAGASPGRWHAAQGAILEDGSRITFESDGADHGGYSVGRIEQNQAASNPFEFSVTFDRFDAGVDTVEVVFLGGHLLVGRNRAYSYWTGGPPDRFTGWRSSDAIRDRVNTVRVQQHGGVIASWINGRRVQDFALNSWPATGNIGLFFKGAAGVRSRLAVRGMEMRSLAEAPGGSPAPRPSSAQPDEPQWGSGPHPVNVRASSAFHRGRERHPATDAFDGVLSTAWNDGVEGDGRGEWLEAHFDERQPIAGFRITLGFQHISRHGHDLFTDNARIRTLRVTADGRELGVWSAFDGQRDLVVGGLHATARDYRFEVVDVWPGARFQDACVSEVAFVAGVASPSRQGCSAVTPDSFHLRSEASARSSGPEYPAGISVEVLRATSVRRHHTLLYEIRVPDGSTGYAFLRPGSTSPGCPPE